MEKQIDIETDVLVVGAGPVGLASGIELGRRNINTLIIEKEQRGGKSPRAKTTNVRTLTHFRRWGIADKLREASPLPDDYPTNVIFATRLNGYRLSKFENVNYCDHILNDYFPETGQWIPQYKVEEVMRNYLITLDCVKIKFGYQLIDAFQTDNYVDVKVKLVKTGEVKYIRCKYLIGADGARTTVRNDVLKIPMSGDHAYDWNYTVVFRSHDIKDKITVGKAVMYWLANMDVPGICGPMDKNDLWFFMATGVSKEKGLPDDPAAQVRLGTGLDINVEVESVEPWAVHKLIADNYRVGRMFLVGDACHLHPPMGGYGMNMGIGDSVDLCWKMAAVLQGWAGESLLDSYYKERKPVHENVVFEAVKNYSLLGNHLSKSILEDSTEEADQVRKKVSQNIKKYKYAEFYTLGVILGDEYKNSPVISHEKNGDEELIDQDDGYQYHPTSKPGCLAPHLWLSNGVSLYDKLGNGMAIICRPEQEKILKEKIADLTYECKVPLNIVACEDNLLKDKYPFLFTLIRPDQFVSWRGNDINDIKDAIKLSLGK